MISPPMMPVVAAMNTAATSVIAPTPPGRPPAHTLIASYRSRATPERSMIAAIRRNIGTDSRT